MATEVLPSAILITTGIFPLTILTVSLTKISFSALVSTLDSPKVPPKIIPFTPAANCASMFLVNKAKSNVSLLVNLVVTAGNTPFQFIAIK